MRHHTASTLKQQVRAALKRWHQQDATTSPLAALVLFQTSLTTHNDIRRATNHLLVQGLERMEQRHPREAMLLRRSFLDNEKNHRLANEQNVSEAKLYRDMGQWADAEAALHAGIAIWRELGDRLARLNVEGNLAITYLRQGRYSQATQLLKRLLRELEAHKPDSAERQKLSACLQPYLAEAVAGERGEGLKKRDPLCTD